MRTILILSITCMIASGIYGVADFSNDLSNGTMIKYNEEEPMVSNQAKAFGSFAKGIKTKTEKADRLSASVVQSDNKTETVSKKKNGESEKSGINTDKIQLKYFSRGQPYIEEETVELEPDSILLNGEDQIYNSENISE